ncbi:amino acid ABC transporter ATP-binding protein [Falseniella ignava]|uniref:ABC transporter domain-containing protein n=1 Tax=Falseniella ignava CCUG 37419 TaxID=883112 RepID=K1LGL2_9LACT|nr:amino acid ABC transporter ATP-binding protein [Falseniella ignava]EKB55755.1 hypothetical protein HMPREF9707_00942 [Falseniella ignava CCUG 37419]
MIKVEHLTKKFGNTVILDDLSFEVKEGEIIGIIGSSGSGKSTLLRCLNLLEKPQNGYLTIDNEKFNLANLQEKDTLRLRKKMSMVFQSFNLFNKKTALENVTEGLIIVQRMEKKAATEKAIKYLSQVGMKDYAQFYPAHLSGGQKQRVAIARALALEPEIILFDEPTSALDPELVNEVLKVIREISQTHDFTMFLVSHEMEFIKSISDRVMFLHNGSILEFANPENIFTNSRHDRIRSFLSQMERE